MLALAERVDAVAWYESVTGRRVVPECTHRVAHRRRDARAGVRVPRQSQPDALERQYVAELRRRAVEIDRALRRQLAGPLEQLGAALEESRADAVTVQIARARDVLLRVISAMSRALAASPYDPSRLERMAAQVAGFADRAVTRQVGAAVGLEAITTPDIPRRMLQRWARENAKLIRSMETRYLDDVAAVVREAVEHGSSLRTVSARLQERLDVSRSRAELIAQDQIGTLNAQITQERQTSLGIEEYRWSSSGDSRVRPLHRELDGTIRRWDDPHPTEGHPGHAVRCRCSAIPVVSRGDHLRLSR